MTDRSSSWPTWRKCRPPRPHRPRFSDRASLTDSGRVKNSAHLLGRNGKLFGHARHFAVFPLPHSGNDDAGEFLRHLLKGFVFDGSVAPGAKKGVEGPRMKPGSFQGF